MRYKIGDRVIFDKEPRVYTVAGIDNSDSEYPYGLKNWKNIFIGWCSEDDLSPAGYLVDSEEATEEFKRLLDSGYFNEDEDLSKKEDKMIKSKEDYLMPIGDKDDAPEKLKTVRFIINNREDRERMVLALANSGYHVWVEDNAEKREYSTPYIYYVCCNVEEKDKE